MSYMRLHVLGPPRVWIDDKPVEFEARKALALLIYLAVSGETHSRDTLATLLWPGYDQKQARTYLRHGLWALKKAVGADWFEITRERVGLSADTDVRVDVADFQRTLAAVAAHGHGDGALCGQCLVALGQAVALYTDDFLVGFTLPDAPDFDEWQFFQSETLRQALTGALERLVRGHAAVGQHEKALPYARRWLALDPLHEPAQYHLILLYARSGQQAAALRQYEAYAGLLQQEFGEPPAQETTALYREIRANRVLEPPPETAGLSPDTGIQKLAPPSDLAASAPALSTPSDSASIPHTVPMSGRLFVGRRKEKAELQRLLLQEDAVRLVTIVGPGGMGKTSLALCVARELLDHPEARTRFADGIYVVSLTAVETVAGMVTAIAEALGLSFYDHAPPHQQLLNHLRGRHILLVLDNFEQLLLPAQRAESLSLLTNMLALGGIKLLVTSRDTLYLQNAWLQSLEGLAFPHDGFVSDQSEADYSAVALFDQHARRVRPDFSLPDERQHVIRICRLVGGMPLALELAATWLRALPIARVAAEIEHNLDILSARSHDLSERHRSMRAVLEQSWAHLDSEERTVLKRLSVFRRRFSQEAAEQVAEASLDVLVSLVDRSLLQFDGVGRYHLHELLRQYAEEKLQEVPADVEATWARHSQYYMGFLQVRAETVTGSTQQAVLRELGEEWENVQAAWNWAIVHNQLDALEQSWEVLHHFYRIRCHFQEGEEAFARLADHLRHGHADALLQRALGCQGAYCIGLSRYDVAKQLLHESLTLARKAGDRREEALVRIALGDADKLQGEYAAAKQQFHDSLALFQDMGDEPGIAQSLNRLAWCLDEDEADYERAARYYQQSLALYRHLEQPAEIALCLDKLGHNNWRRGNYVESSRLHTESLSLYRELGDPMGIANALGGLGLIALSRGGSELTRAEALMQESVTVCRQTSNRYEEANRLRMLAMVYNSLGDYERGRQYAQEGLAGSRETGYEQGVIVNLLSLGEAACGLGDFSAAREALLQAMQRARAKSKIAQVLESLLYWAELLLAESRDAAGDGEQTRTNDPLCQVREFLVLVRHHRSSWHHFKERAARLLAQQYPGISEVNAKNERARSTDDVVTEILQTAESDGVDATRETTYRSRRGPTVAGR